MEWIFTSDRIVETSRDLSNNANRITNFQSRNFARVIIKMSRLHIFPQYLPPKHSSRGIRPRTGKNSIFTTYFPHVTTKRTFSTTLCVTSVSISSLEFQNRNSNIARFETKSTISEHFSRMVHSSRTRFANESS